MDNEALVRQIYSRRTRPPQHDSLSSPEVVMQGVFRDYAIHKAINVIASRGLDFATAKILDVGAASGGTLAPFMGATIMPPGNLYGIDILPERVALGRNRYPGVNFTQADATALPFDAGFFDLCTQFFMLTQVPEDVGQKVAGEMVRVTRPGGYVLSMDWGLGSKRKGYHAVNMARLRRLFPGLTKVGEASGQIVPPVGRFLSARGARVYLLAWSLVPYLPKARAVVFQKPL